MPSQTTNTQRSSVASQSQGLNGRRRRGQEEEDEREGEGEEGPTASIRYPAEEENCFRILIATDNHIGYNERDPVRGQDSINTFKEILEIAREKEVDFILLAGDLFHENRPSRSCLHQTIALLREYTLGDRPVQMELLSDPMEGNTPGFNFPAINYEDPNLNVGTPVFSIHGNHDDPQGTGPEGALCALDVLAAAGVINYFGKIHLALSSTDETNPTANKKSSTSASAAAQPVDPNDPNSIGSGGIKIRPVLLQKGETRLAMYGIGNVKDTRMHYELRSNRVRMFMPEEEEGMPWFNLLLIHQNRVKHGPQNSVPEGMFDDSIDLVIWGHEHDCRIDPEKVANKPYYISQPGSSVATSLAHGEAIPKKVGLLEIQRDQFHLEPIPLQTVRPFKISEVVLADEAEEDENAIDLSKRETITGFLKEKIEEMIKEAEDEWAETHGGSKENMMLPLIRLKVETTGAKELTNGPRIGQEFKERIANPKDVIQYYKKKTFNRGNNVAIDQPDFDEMEEDGLLASNGNGEGISKLRMGELVKKYLQAQTLEVLKEDELEDAVTRYVDKDDPDAIKDFVNEVLTDMTGGLKKNESNIDLDNEESFRHMIAQQKEKFSSQHALRPANAKKGKQTGRGRAQSVDSMMEEDDFMDVDNNDDDRSSVASSSRGGRGAAAKKAPAKKATAAATKKAAASKTTAAAKGKKKQAPLFDDSEDEAEASQIDSDEEEGEEASFQPRSRAAAGKTTTAARGGASTRGRGASISGARQSQLSFAPSQGRGAAARQPNRAAASKAAIVISDEDSD